METINKDLLCCTEITLLVYVLSIYFLFCTRLNKQQYIIQFRQPTNTYQQAAFPTQHIIGFLNVLFNYIA